MFFSPWAMFIFTHGVQRTNMVVCCLVLQLDTSTLIRSIVPASCRFPSTGSFRRCRTYTRILNRISFIHFHFLHLAFSQSTFSSRWEKMDKIQRKYNLYFINNSRHSWQLVQTYKFKIAWVQKPHITRACEK